LQFILSAVPLYRSILLWLGLLGLLFLLWSWNRSLNHLSLAEGTIAGRSAAIGVANGSLVIIRTAPTSGPRVYELYFDDQPLDPSTRAAVPTPAAMAVFPGSEGVMIAMWIPVAIYLTAWSGLFYWRHRRMRHRRHMTIEVGQSRS